MGTFIDDNNTDVIIDVDKCTQCLNYQLICSITYEKAFNPEKARITIERASTGEKITRFTEECTSCNLCVDYCVYGGITLA
jgi:Fe-S-cluster-containing dehydrogenase component